METGLILSTLYVNVNTNVKGDSELWPWLLLHDFPLDDL